MSESEVLKEVMQKSMVAMKNILVTQKELGPLVIYLFTDERGMVYRFLQWQDLEEKRKVQKEIQKYILEYKPMGALVVSDVFKYVAQLDKISKDDLTFPDGLKDVPGREEAIFIIGGCKEGVFCLSQTYNRTTENTIIFKDDPEYFQDPDQNEIFANVWDILAADDSTTH